MRRWFRLALIALAALSCETVPQDAGPPLPTRIVDLTPTLHPRAPAEQWGQTLQRAYSIPDSLPFTARIGDPVYSMFTTITLADHVGAHVDAPLHLIPDGDAVEELELSKFVGPIRLLDLRSAPPDEPIGPRQLRQFDLGEGDVVLILTGYQPPSDPEVLPSYPYLTGGGAEYLASLGIRAFGSDMPSTGSFRQYRSLIDEEPTSQHVIPDHLVASNTTSSGPRSSRRSTNS